MEKHCNWVAPADGVRVLQHVLVEGFSISLDP